MSSLGEMCLWASVVPVWCSGFQATGLCGNVRWELVPYRTVAQNTQTQGYQKQVGAVFRSVLRRPVFSPDGLGCKEHLLVKSSAASHFCLGKNPPISDEKQDLKGGLIAKITLLIQLLCLLSVLKLLQCKIFASNVESMESNILSSECSSYSHRVWSVDV